MDCAVVVLERGGRCPRGSEDFDAAGAGALPVNDAVGKVAIGRNTDADQRKSKLGTRGAKQLLVLRLGKRVLRNGDLGRTVEEDDACAEAVDPLARGSSVDGAACRSRLVRCDGAVYRHGEIPGVAAVDPTAVSIASAVEVGVERGAVPSHWIGAAHAGDFERVHVAGSEGDLVVAGEIEP